MSVERPSSIRERAERLLAERGGERSGSRSSMETMEVLVHELEVHQVELEIQNENLRQTELDLRESRDRYFALFDLAPVAYITMQQDGTVIEANLKAATLLGVERQSLVQRRFSAFVARDYGGHFHLFRERVLETGTQQTCELKLVRRGGAPLPGARRVYRCNQRRAGAQPDSHGHHGPLRDSRSPR